MTEPGSDGSEGAAHPGHGLMTELAMGSPVALVVIGADRRVVLVNPSARTMLGLSEGDLGRPFTDLGIARRAPELVARIAAALEGRGTVALRAVPWSAGSSAMTHLDIEGVPVFGGSGTIDGLAITLTDATRLVELQGEVEGARRELRTAHEELRTMTEELTATIEELKATNEELAAVVVELETTGYEVQLGKQLRDGSSAVTRPDAFAQSILDSFDGAVVVVDPDIVVQAWSRQAEHLWGLSELGAVGRPLLSLDSGLPGQALRPWLVAVIGGAERRVHRRRLDAVVHGKRTVNLGVTITPMLGSEDDVTGAIVLFEEKPESTST